MPSTTYSFEERTILLAHLESTYGADPHAGDPADYMAIPIYDAFNPIQHTQGSNDLNRASGSLASDGAYTTEALSALRFKTYVFNSGTATPPAWASILLPISGFEQADITGSAPAIIETTATGTDGALSDGTYKVKLAVRTDATGSMTAASAEDTVAATANQHLVVTWDGSGLSGKTVIIYRTKAGGSVFYRSGEATATAGTFTDLKADTALDYSQQPPGAAGSAIYYTPMNQDHASAYFYAYLDSHRRVAAGARGSWTGEFNSGAPMEMNWELQGIYTAGAGASNPSVPGVCSGPGMPPRVVSAGYYLIPTTNGAGATTFSGGAGVQITQGGGSTPLVVKRISCSPGTQPAVRRSANAADGVIEIGIHQRYKPTLEITCEVDKNYAWDPVEDYKRGVQFSTGWLVGSGTNRKVNFDFANCQIVAAPELTREDDGIRCWRLQFRPLVLLNCYDWMRVTLS